MITVEHHINGILFWLPKNIKIGIYRSMTFGTFVLREYDRNNNIIGRYEHDDISTIVEEFMSTHEYCRHCTDEILKEFTDANQTN